MDKKCAANNSEIPKYYVEGSHEAVIYKDVFIKVKAEIVRRANLNPDGKHRVYSSKYALSGMVICEHYGASTAEKNGATEAVNPRSGDAQAGFLRERWILTVRHEW